MTGRKKGVSIGVAMKQRMSSGQDLPDEQQEVLEEPGLSEATSAVKPVPQPITTVEDDPLESFNTRLPRSLQRRLKVYVALNNTKIQNVIYVALDEYLQKKEL